MMETEEWDDDGDEGCGLSHHEWDLEDALASAILGDVGSLTETPVVSLVAGVSSRDEAEEERLIERLHSKLFPTERVTVAAATGSRARCSSTATSQVAKKTDSGAGRKSTTISSRKSIAESTESTASVSRHAISPAKVEEMLSRFRLQEAKRSRKLALLVQQQHGQPSSASSTGSGVSTGVSPRSRELTRDLPSFEQRQAAALARREHELSIRRLQQQQQLTPRSLKLAVERPCLCGAERRQDHSPTCERFMETCEKLNATSEIHLKKQQMRRSVDDLMRLHEQTKRKQRMMAETLRQRELQEATFTPQINALSVKIYEDLVESGRLQGRSSSRPATTPSPRLPSPPLQPQLSTQDRLLLEHRNHPPQRTLPKTRRRSSIVSRSSSVSCGSYRNRSSRPRHGKIPLAASFSESHWLQRVSRATDDASSSKPLLPGAPVFTAPWTSVAFDAAKARFILQNFDLPASFP